MSFPCNYVVVTPVRDEARHIDKTVVSMAAQSILPAQWVVVNDGSTDETASILDRHAGDHDWMTVVHRENRGFRAPGSGVVEAFYAGYAAIRDPEWDFIVKLDGDLSFEPDYFANCFECFEQDPTLGIAGGTVCRREGDELVVDSIGDPPFHVRGATKIYRRRCWEQIEPLVRAPGWDTIDEVKANLFGWTTRTIDPLTLVQHKPTGAADGSWRNAFKNGRANYVTGYHPLFMAAKGLKRLGRKPYLLQSAALICGYTSGYLTRTPRQAGADAIRYLRHQQLNRLLLRPSIYGKGNQ